MFNYARKLTPELETQKAIDTYCQGGTENILKCFFENRFEQIQRGEYWDGDINDLQKQITIQLQKYKKKKDKQNDIFKLFWWC